MRKLSLTSLTLLATFALGFILGGQAPREATAQDELEEITWHNDGHSLTFINWTDEQGFFVEGSFRYGSTEPIPDPRNAGKLVVSAADIQGLLVSKKIPLFYCDGIGCRSCDDVPTLCVYPPRPLPEPPIYSSLDPYYPR